MKEFLVEQVLSGSLLLALPIAVVAGLISFASPCVLPLVPGYLAYASGGAQTRARLFLGSLLFVSGFTVLFMSYGALFGELGSRISENRETFSKILGALTIVFGVIYLFPERFYRGWRRNSRARTGLLSAPFLGLMFGLGWTPCIGPTLGAVQTLAASESSAVRGAILSFGYCLGLGAPFLFFALAIDSSKKVQSFLMRKSRILALAGGLVLVTVGVLQISGLWESAMINLRSAITSFVPVL